MARSKKKGVKQDKAVLAPADSAVVVPLPPPSSLSSRSPHATTLPTQRTSSPAASDMVAPSYPPAQDDLCYGITPHGQPPDAFISSLPYRNVGHTFTDAEGRRYIETDPQPVGHHSQYYTAASGHMASAGYHYASSGNVPVPAANDLAYLYPSYGHQPYYGQQYRDPASNPSYRHNAPQHYGVVHNSRSMPSMSAPTHYLPPYARHHPQQYDHARYSSNRYSLPQDYSTARQYSTLRSYESQAPPQAYAAPQQYIAPSSQAQPHSTQPTLPPTNVRYISSTQSTLPANQVRYIPPTQHSKVASGNKSPPKQPSRRYNLRSTLASPRRSPRRTPQRPQTIPPSPPSPQPQSPRILRAPSPSPEYLALASRACTRLSTPQPVLIISDLNGTLLYRKRAGSTSYKPRPGLAAFLHYIFTTRSPHANPKKRDTDAGTIHPMIWTSAQPETCAILLSSLLSPPHKSACVAIWARNTLRLTTQQYHSKVQVFKKLDWVWADPAIQATHPMHDMGGKWDQTNTLLIDDSAVKAAAQPYNVVNLPEFDEQAMVRESEAEAEEGEQVLRQVVAYLDEVRWWSNVSTFVKGRPFRIGEWVGEGPTGGANVAKGRRGQRRTRQDDGGVPVGL